MNKKFERQQKCYFKNWKNISTTGKNPKCECDLFLAKNVCFITVVCGFYIVFFPQKKPKSGTRT